MNTRLSVQLVPFQPASRTACTFVPPIIEVHGVYLQSNGSRAFENTSQRYLYLEITKIKINTETYTRHSKGKSYQVRIIFVQQRMYCVHELEYVITGTTYRQLSK